MAHRDRERTSLEVSVIVPVGRHAPDLRACLDSISRLSPAPLEVIVVLDGPSETNQRVVRAAGLEPFATQTPRGPAAARNEGARRAKGDLLLFLDADVTVPGDLVARSLRPFERGERLTALIGSYDDDPGDPAFLSQYRNLLHHFVHQTSPTEGFTFWGACGVIRRAAFLGVGGFDERYRQPSVEDIELGYRLCAEGHQIRLVHSLQVKHLKRWRSLDLLHTDVMRRGVPWTRLILRHRRLDSGLNIGPGHRLSALAGLGMLAALGLAPLAPGAALGAALILAALLTALNLGFYRFLWTRRGPRFALRSVPLHWVFHACSGVAAVAGTVAHVLPRVQPPSVSTPAGDYS